MTDEKKGILLIEPDNNLRSFYSVPLKKSGLFTTFVAASASEGFHTIESSKCGEIQIILLNANISDMPFQVLIQKVRNHSSTFQSEIYLFSNELTSEDKFILKEMSVKNVFPFKMESGHLLVALQKNLEIKLDNLLELKISKLELYLKSEEIEKCDEIMTDESFKVFLEKSSDYIHLLGEYLLLKKENEKCCDLLNHYIHKSDADLDIIETMTILNTLGKALCLCGKYKEATLIFKKISEKSPKNLGHKINLSKTYIASAEWEKASQILKSVLEVDPYNESALISSAQALIGLNKPIEAISFLEKAAGTVEYHSISSFFNNRGIAAIHSDEFEQAEGFYKNALFFTKRHTGKILFNLGLALYKNNKLEESKKIFEKIKDTDDAEYLNKSKNILNKIELM